MSFFRLFGAKTLLVAVFAALALGATWAQPQVALAQPTTDRACGAIGGCDNAESDLQNVIETVVDIFSLIVGIAAVVMLMVGGFKYVTSGGDSGKTASAKNTIIYAIIGLAIAALSQFIVFFILDRVL